MSIEGFFEKIQRQLSFFDVRHLLGQVCLSIRDAWVFLSEVEFLLKIIWRIMK